MLLRHLILKTREIILFGFSNLTILFGQYFFLNLTLIAIGKLTLCIDTLILLAIILKIVFFLDFPIRADAGVSRWLIHRLKQL